MTKPSGSLDRFCLVTVGATVGFKELTEAVLEPQFWAFLKALDFTELHIQCGPDVAWASARLATLKDEVPSNLVIDIFDVRKNLMKEEMVICKAIPNQRREGLVISHAGWYLTSLTVNVNSQRLRYRNHIRRMEARNPINRGPEYSSP